MGEQQTFLEGGPYMRVNTNATPASPGTGPEGETCRTCANRLRVSTGSQYFQKCAKIRQTNGPGTDIKVYWPACEHWERKDG